MTIWAIGDIHGCHEELKQLLDLCQLDESCDEIWLAGDLINAGPDSLAVIHLLQSLKCPVTCVWGNHDLYAFTGYMTKDCQANREHADEIVAYLLKGQLLAHKQVLGDDGNTRHFALTHAGVHPRWTWEQTLHYQSIAQAFLLQWASQEFENGWSTGPSHKAIIEGNESSLRQTSGEQAKGADFMRWLVNVFTRMRLTNQQGDLLLTGPQRNTPAWPVAGKPNPHRGNWFDFDCEVMKEPSRHWLFGHWAMLKGETRHDRIHALDTGCVYGNQLTAFNLTTLKRCQVNAKQAYRTP